MLRASVLTALLLSACPSRGAPPAGLGAAPQSHFSIGHQAFSQGRYEVTLHEMMLTLIEKPNDSRAREYMRLAGDELVSQNLKELSRERSALLSAYREALEAGRLRTQAWQSRLTEAGNSASRGRWARSYDDAQRVLEDNSSHADAIAARRNAAAGLARVLASGGAFSLSPKDLLIYRGLIFLSDARFGQAREALGSALTLPEAGEIEDARLRMYAALAAPAPAPAPAPGLQAGLPGADGAAAAGSAQGRPETEQKPRKPAAAPVRQWTAEEIAVRRADAARLYSAGLVLYGRGNKAEAVASWRQAVELDPENKYASRALKHTEKELQEGLQ